MKCTDKRVSRITALMLVCPALIWGCGTKTYDLTDAYDVYGTQIEYAQETDGEQETEGQSGYFASDLCVGEDEERNLGGIHADFAQALGVFHIQSKTVTCSKNIYKKMYPASTTKILTAYVALKYGNPSDEVTVSANAANQAADSSVCYLREGDRLSLEQLLYGLLLKSGNDAAVAIAEHISGDVDSFAELMNQEAAALGATHSHFVNPHGLPDKKHYTCVYDLYLMFQAALSMPEFTKIIGTSEYTADYRNADGVATTQEWVTTDRFLTGEAQTPDGVTVIGGKTGTTDAAGNCLVLASTDQESESVISIVLKADSRENLYQLMTELLER